MSYFKVLGFNKELFSTSPDPEFFYLSKEHETALSNILIELRLKRGLPVILEAEPDEIPEVAWEDIKRYFENEVRKPVK